MNARLLWILACGLLVPGMAGAQATDEGSGEESDEGAETPADEGSQGDGGQASEAGTAPAATAPAGAAPAATAPAATAPAATAPAGAAPADDEAPDTTQPATDRDDAGPGPVPPPRGHRMKAVLAKIPQLQFSWGGFRLAVLDPGYGAVSDTPSMESFHASFDIWVHPNLSVAVSWSDSGEKSDWLSTPSGQGLRVALRARSLDVAARALLAPAWMPLRPVARVGVGVLGARYSVVDDSVAGNLKGRESDGAAPYLRLGLGLELTSPRYGRDAHRATNPQRKVRWGLGGFIEGGALIGGGGSVPGAPSIAFGDEGRLDLGPLSVRGGATLFF